MPLNQDEQMHYIDVTTLLPSALLADTALIVPHGSLFPEWT